MVPYIPVSKKGGPGWSTVSQTLVLSWGQGAVGLALESHCLHSDPCWAPASLSGKVPTACPSLHPHMPSGGRPGAPAPWFPNIWQEEAPSSLTLQDPQRKTSRTDIRGSEALNIPLRNVYLMLDKNIPPYLWKKKRMK